MYNIQKLREKEKKTAGKKIEKRVKPKKIKKFPADKAGKSAMQKREG